MTPTQSERATHPGHVRPCSSGERLDDHDRGDDDEDRDRVAQFTKHRLQHTDSDEQRLQRLGQALAEPA